MRFAATKPSNLFSRVLLQRNSPPGSCRCFAHAAIDTARYPIDGAGSDRELLVARCREALQSAGVVTIPGFIRAEAIKAAAAEAQELVPLAYHCNNTHNAYLAPDDLSFSPEHIRRMQLRTDVGSVAYDHLPRDGHLATLYQCEALLDFISAVVKGGGTKKILHRLADPLGACTINVFHKDWEHGWHFDEAEFTTTLMLQTAEDGGHFEFTPQIREAGVEEAYEQVAKIIKEDDQSLVQSLCFEPGTLSIFKGCSSLHRVTQVHGDRPRLVAVLCFAEEAGVTNSADVRQLFWGRSE